MSILPHPAASGEALRDAALSLLRAHRAALVRRIQRAFLRQLIDCGPDTSDAVRPLVPIPAGIDPRVVGAAVRTLAADYVLIVSTGRQRSRRPLAHARNLDVWAVRDRAAAERWLIEHPELTEPDPAADDTADPFAI